jgi:hypothetical protein
VTAAASVSCPARIALGLVGACLGVGDLAGGVLPGGADVAVRVLAGLADLRGGAVADAAYLLLGVGAELREFAFEFFHAGHGLGRGVVGLVSLGAGGGALGLGGAAALDLLSEAGLCGGDALVGAGARGVHLGLGRLDVADLAQLPSPPGLPPPSAPRTQSRSARSAPATAA